MRPAEPARLVSLKYVVGQDASADTMAIMRLVLDDEASPLAGREFEVEMPPPHHGQAEFVMLRSRFEAAMARGWQSEDACKVRHTALRSNCSIRPQHLRRNLCNLLHFHSMMRAPLQHDREQHTCIRAWPRLCGQRRESSIMAPCHNASLCRSTTRTRRRLGRGNGGLGVWLQTCWSLRRLRRLFRTPGAARASGSAMWCTGQSLRCAHCRVPEIPKPL